MVCLTKIQNTSRVKLRDIAERMGISVSAVNKALTGRTGVSDQLRQKVINTANEMGYHVNRTAQSLSRNAIRLGIVIPNLYPNFYGQIHLGMESMLRQLNDYRISAETYYVPTLYSKKQMVDGIKYFVDLDVDAIILCPNFVTDFDDAFELLCARGIPMVIIGSELKNSNRLCCIGHDSFLAGKLAAEFMRYIVPEGKHIAIFIGNKSMIDHHNKVSGFAHNYPDLNLTTDIFETLDEPEMAHLITRKLLNQRSDIGGIYVATGNALAVCEAVNEMGMEKNIHVVGTDILQQMQPFFETGPLRGVIFQDPFKQGKLAVQVLFDYLTINKSPSSQILVCPQVVLGSNFTHYICLDTPDRIPVLSS